jgi:hypothetical protein
LLLTALGRYVLLILINSARVATVEAPQEAHEWVLIVLRPLRLPLGPKQLLCRWRRPTALRLLAWRHLPRRLLLLLLRH